MTGVVPRRTRTQVIASMLEAGETYRRIGDAVGVTFQRIGQIVSESPRLREARDRGQAKRKTELLERQGRRLATFRDLLASEPDAMVSTLARRCSLDLGVAERIAGRDEIVRRRAAHFESMSHKLIGLNGLPKETILDHLRSAGARVDGPLTMSSYDRVARLIPGAILSQAVILRFGSWTEACRAAGVEYLPSHRSAEGYVRIGRDQIERCVLEFVRMCDEQDVHPSVVRYERTQAIHRGPSSKTVRSIFPDRSWPRGIAEIRQKFDQHP